MYQDTFYLACDGNTDNDPPMPGYPESVALTLTLATGTLLFDENALVVTYGQSTAYPGSYPVVSFVPTPQQLRFSQSVNGVYVQMGVHFEEPTIVGNLTVDPALPVDIYLSTSYASAVLEAGSTSLGFEFAISGTPGTSPVLPAAARRWRDAGR